MNVKIIFVVGVVAIAAYLVVSSTRSTTGSSCAGDWTDNFNPACWAENVTNGATAEINTILIILGAVVVIVVGLLAFGPQTGHIAGAASSLALV